MLARLSGVIGVLSVKEVAVLRRGIRSVEQPEELTASEGVGFVQMTRRGSSNTLDLLDLEGGRFGVRSDEGFIWKLGEDALKDAGVSEWLRSWRPPTDAGGGRVVFDGTGAEAPLTLDTNTSRRVFRATYPKLTREIREERFRVRLPAGFESWSQSGLLVWVSPTPDGRIPPMFEEALDRFGFIAIGVDGAGNTRQLNDRLQVMLDAVETVRQRYLLDEERVYVTGMSGGGRVSTLLQCALPSMFAGAVPIVGMDSYHNAPTGEGRTYWPAKIGKPPRPILRELKTRRIAAITGDMDFNEPEMRVRTELMVDDGLQVRLDVHPGMGHVMPTASHFADALEWVDEPRRTAIEQSISEAQGLLGSIGSGATEAEVRAVLIEVMRLAPWTKPGWEAAERLGYSRWD